MRSGIRFVALVAIVFLGVAVIGCQPNVEPIERGASTLMLEVVKPAVSKAADELSARTAQLQGQGSLINPGYVVDGFANFGPGVAYRFSIATVGVSANISGATQADAGQAGSVPPPAMRQAPTQPE